MEANKTRVRAIVIAAAVLLLVAAVVAAPLLIRKSKGPRTGLLKEYARSDLPILDLQLQFVDSDGNEITPEHSRLLGASGGETAGGAPAATDKCPELVGGDTGGGASPPRGKRGENCPKTATWKVRRQPVAFSLYFRDAKKILALIDSDPRMKELLETKFFRGLFSELLHSGDIRAEDLRIEGAEGAFLKKLVREALKAHGELHYDLAHGSKGFVFSFVLEECAYASTALPLVVKTLARSGYRIPTLENPILEMRVGLQRVFLALREGRVYVANGLEALINSLESLPEPGGRPLPEAPLVLAARGEAFVDKLIPVVFGGESWEADFGLTLRGDQPGVLRLDCGKAAEGLRPGIFKGVFASIPHDVFAALATGFYLPPEMSDEEWRRLGAGGADDGTGREGMGGDKTKAPDQAGFALIWDISSDGGRVSNVGVAVANQTTPDAAAKFSRYFAKPELTAQCGGGTVFLAATSQNLLARMRESCEGRSLSVLDWERGARAGDYAASQLFLFANPGGGMRELFLAGGAKSGDADDFEEKLLPTYEAAKEAMRKDCEKVFGSLPILAFFGNAPSTAQTVELKGLTIRQGASR